MLCTTRWNQRALFKFQNNSLLLVRELLSGSLSVGDTALEVREKVLLLMQIGRSGFGTALRACFAACGDHRSKFVRSVALLPVNVFTRSSADIVGAQLLLRMRGRPS